MSNWCYLCLQEFPNFLPLPLPRPPFSFSSYIFRYISYPCSLSSPSLSLVLLFLHPLNCPFSKPTNCMVIYNNFKLINFLHQQFSELFTQKYNSTFLQIPFQHSIFLHVYYPCLYPLYFYPMMYSFYYNCIYCFNNSYVFGIG